MFFWDAERILLIVYLKKVKYRLDQLDEYFVRLDLDCKRIIIFPLVFALGALEMGNQEICSQNSWNIHLISSNLKINE